MTAPEIDWSAEGLWTQRYTASLRRRDGHTIDGIPGDCWRTALAYVVGCRRDDVPHFGLYLSWWEETRRWLRARYHLDIHYVEAAHPEDWGHVPAPLHGQDDYDPDLVMLGGPSPRGPFDHVVAGLRDGTVVWDPHPSRAGLLAVTDYFVLGPPYYLVPPRAALEAAA